MAKENGSYKITTCETSDNDKLKSGRSLNPNRNK